MFDKLDDILMRLEEVLNQLSEPDVAADAAKFQKLMKEQAELQPIADAYKDYKTQKQTIEESLMLLEEESDEEMREMLKEEHSLPQKSAVCTSNTQREPRLENRADQRR